MASSVFDVREKLASILDKIKTQLKGYEEKLKSPFVPEEKVRLAITGISEQIDRLELRIKDCERLEELCR
ncbi:hypothetical protein D3C72_2493610 [compost metagenome]